MELAEAERLAGRLLEGDIVLVSESGLQHIMNKALQNSRWNHVMLYIGNGLTIEVTPHKGVHICDFLYDLTAKPYVAYKILRMPGLSLRARRNIVKLSVKVFRGKKFSWKHYAKSVHGRALKFGHTILAPGHKCDMSSLVCSNMVAMAYYMSGHPISSRYLPEYVIPRDYESARNLKTVEKWSR